MELLLAAIGFIGLGTIFYRVFKRVRRQERVKVTPDMMQNANVRTRRDEHPNFRSAMNWKRPDIDYKELHATFSNADMQLTKGNLSEAEQGFIRVIALKPNHQEANNKLGLLYLKQGRHKKAEEIYRFLTEEHPEKAVYYSNLGRALYNQKRLQESAYAYEHAIRLDSKRIERYLSLGQVYREMEQFKLSISTFSRALDLNPRQEDLYFLITDLLDEIKAYSEAIAYLRAMLELFPYNERAKRLITEFQRKMKLSPLSTEQKAQMREARVRQNTLFEDIPAGETIPQTKSSLGSERIHQSVENFRPPSKDQLSLADMQDLVAEEGDQA